MVAVLIPVLNRPHRASPVAESLAASVEAGQAEPVFLCSPGDQEEIAAVAETKARLIVVPWEPGPGDYWKKLNLGYWQAVQEGAEWVFAGADDLRFHPGWLDRALAAHARTGACVVGTNDLGNRRVIGGWHSTHSLVHRDYLECGTADEAGLIFHEGYGHWFGDDEFIQTAIARRTFTMAHDAIVEHLHPDWGKAEMDGTYRKGQESASADGVLFRERKHLWTGRQR